MLCLAIETSSPVGSAALFRGSELLGSLSHDTPNAHAEQLLPLVERLVAQVGVRQHDLQQVAVGLGPGSFTGLRVGIALAQGIATGLGIEAVGVGSLPNLALAPSRLEASRVYGALLDARRGEYFFGAYDHQGLEVVAPRTIPQKDAAHQIRVLVGDRMIAVSGSSAHHCLPPDMLSDVPEAFPTAARIARLLQLGLERSDLSPLYLRDADAKLPNLPPNPIAR